MNSFFKRKERIIELRYRTILFTISFAIFFFITYATDEARGENLLDNGGFETWSKGTLFNSPDNAQITVDGWATNRDGEAVFSISRHESLSTINDDKYSAEIFISESKGAHVIDFYQTIKDKDKYKSDKLTFTAKVRANKPGVCRIIINDDSGTAASRFNESTDWEILNCTKTVSSGKLTYLNAAIRIKADEPSVIYINDSKVLNDHSAFGSIKNSFMLLLGSVKRLNIYKTYQELNRSTIFAVDIMLCMLLLGIIMRIFPTINPFVYQLQLATVGLIFTLYLWANSWENYVILYSSWFFFTFILMHLFTKSIRVLILCCVFIVSLYYFRGKVGNVWDSFLYLGTLQLQFMRSMDIVTTDIEYKNPLKNRLLAFIAYIGVPVNVNNYYYVRYKLESTDIRI